MNIIINKQSSLIKNNKQSSQYNTIIKVVYVYGNKFYFIIIIMKYNNKLIKLIINYIYSDDQLNNIFNYHNQKYTL